MKNTKIRWVSLLILAVLYESMTWLRFLFHQVSYSIKHKLKKLILTNSTYCKKLLCRKASSYRPAALLWISWRSKVIPGGSPPPPFLPLPLQSPLHPFPFPFRFALPLSFALPLPLSPAEPLWQPPVSAEAESQNESQTYTQRDRKTESDSESDSDSFVSSHAGSADFMKAFDEKCRAYIFVLSWVAGIAVGLCDRIHDWAALPGGGRSSSQEEDVRHYRY